jgi:hypothetical protein
MKRKKLAWEWALDSYLKKVASPRGQGDQVLLGHHDDGGVGRFLPGWRPPLAALREIPRQARSVSRKRTSIDRERGMK